MYVYWSANAYLTRKYSCCWQQRRHFAAHALKEFWSARSAPLWNFQRASAGLQLGDRHFFKVLFGEGWKKMTSIPIFLTLWILVVFAGPSDEDILMIKVRTKHEKSPKTWSLRFDLLEIKMCRWDGKPWRLALRCWCFTCKNHKVVCEDDCKILIWSDERS